MSESNGGSNGHRKAASISGPRKRQGYLERREVLEVWSTEAENEPLEPVEVVAREDQVIILKGTGVASLAALEAGEDPDGWKATGELDFFGVLRFQIDSIQPAPAEDGDLRIGATVSLRSADGQEVPEALKEALSGLLDDASVKALGGITPGMRATPSIRRTRRQWYGNLTVAPHRLHAAQVQTARLEKEWRRDHDLDEAAPLPDEAWREIRARGEAAGGLIESFSGFRDDDGEIPGKLESGALNVEGLVRVLSLVEMRAPLDALYRQRQEDVETWLFFQNRQERSSPGISATPIPTETGPPS